MIMVEVLLLCAAGVAASAQSAPAAANAGQPDSVRPASAKEKKLREMKLRRELVAPWKQWLNEDVVYIITDEERSAFKALQTDDERQNFVEEFWLRRDPTPNTIENEFEDEHYRRIAYANDDFASVIPGWKTDRGRIYIMYGPPDGIESHRADGEVPYPSEDWRYRHIEGIGANILFEFVDVTGTGEYHVTMDPDSGHALTQQSPSQDRSASPRLENFEGLSKPPAIQYTDLEEVISTNINYHTLPMNVRVDYFRATDCTVLTPITVSLRKADLQYKRNGGYARATVEIFGRVTTMSRRVITTFEASIVVETSSELLSKTMGHTAIYQKSVPLPAGIYQLNVVARDIVGGTITNYEMALNVPRYEDDRLAGSTLILADMIEKVPTRSIGASQFVIGDSKVRPRMDATFNTSERLGIYQHFYNFAADDKTKKPNGSIEYSVMKNGTGEKVFDYTEEIANLPGASAQQVTVAKLLLLDKLWPGQYELQLKVTDRIRNQTFAPSATFTVTEANPASPSVAPAGSRLAH